MFIQRNTYTSQISIILLPFPGQPGLRSDTIINYYLVLLQSLKISNIYITKLIYMLNRVSLLVNQNLKNKKINSN